MLNRIKIGLSVLELVRAYSGRQSRSYVTSGRARIHLTFPTMRTDALERTVEHVSKKIGGTNVKKQKFDADSYFDITVSVTVNI